MSEDPQIPNRIIGAELHRFIGELNTAVKFAGKTERKSQEGRAVRPAGIEKLSADCLRVINLLSMPAKQIDQYVSGGRPTEYSTLLMSAHVAMAMRHTLEIAPKSTKDGLYLKILEVIFEAATGREPKAIHELARRALKIEATEYPGGGVLFEPENTI